MPTNNPDQPIAVARAVGADSSFDNPYLMGVYAPVQTELSLEDMEVIGEVPRDLNGVYLRNGPNRRFEGGGGW